MKSNKQRKAEIVALRRDRASKQSAAAKAVDPREIDLRPPGTAPCNSALLAPFNSYGVPTFVSRGFYIDTAFDCAGCRKQEVWRATQQKWWYEVAKGNVESRAKLCATCRRVERERQAEARRVHLDGVAKKLAAKRTP